MKKTKKDLEVGRPSVEVRAFGGDETVRVDHVTGSSSASLGEVCANPQGGCAGDTSAAGRASFSAPSTTINE